MPLSFLFSFSFTFFVVVDSGGSVYLDDKESIMNDFFGFYQNSIELKGINQIYTQ